MHVFTRFQYRQRSGQYKSSDFWWLLYARRIAVGGQSFILSPKPGGKYCVILRDVEIRKQSMTATAAADEGAKLSRHSRIQSECFFVARVRGRLVVRIIRVTLCFQLF